MMRLFLTLAVIFLVCCQKEKHESTSNKNAGLLTHISRIQFHEFFDILDEHLIATSSIDKLTFIKKDGFDSSFVFVFKRDTAAVIGFYYWISPYDTYLSSHEEQFLFFEGLSFRKDSASWNGLLKKFSALRAPIDEYGESGCNGCIKYLFVSNGQFKYNNSNDKAFGLVIDSLRSEVADIAKAKNAYNSFRENLIREGKL